MKIAILGAALDPIHLGHTRIAENVLASTDVAEVWLTPCFRHKFGKELAPPHHRLEMCRLAVQDNPRLKAWDYEIRHELPGETFHFVTKLKSDDEYKDHQFSFIMSIDNANTFHTWYKSDTLERMVPFIVLPRKGYQANEKMTWYLREPHIFLKDAETFEISSTAIRTMLSECNKESAKFLHPAVFQYIMESGLYGSKP